MRLFIERTPVRVSHSGSFPCYYLLSVVSPYYPKLVNESSLAIFSVAGTRAGEGRMTYHTPIVNWSN